MKTKKLIQKLVNKPDVLGVVILRREDALRLSEQAIDHLFFPGRFPGRKKGG